jgi:hypothetical protein
MSKILCIHYILDDDWGTWYRSWLRRYHASRKVADSIPNEATGIFNCLNPSSRIMVIGSTQPLTEISTRNLPEVKVRPDPKPDNLTTICEPPVYKMLEPRRLTNLWAYTACYRDCLACKADNLTAICEPIV